MNAELYKALEQVQKMQDEVAKAQEALGSITASSEAGGGMVKVTANGKGEIVAVKLEKEVIDPNEQEMMEDLIVAAANRALNKARDLADEKMSKITSNFLPDIPGLSMKK
jgi:DNA-binding YbaB/EbfC family protein